MQPYVRDRWNNTVLLGDYEAGYAWMSHLMEYLQSPSCHGNPREVPGRGVAEQPITVWLVSHRLFSVFLPFFFFFFFFERR